MLRAAGVLLPPKTGGKAKATWYRTVLSYQPRKMTLTYKGATVPIVNEAIIRDHDVEPTIQYFLSVPVKNSLSTAFKVGTGTGTLKFTTSVSGPISIRVPIRITQRD